MRISSMSWMVFAMVASILVASQADAQVQVVTYPNGTVKYEAIAQSQPKPAATAVPSTAPPKGSAAVEGVSCCDGSSSGGPCLPTCKKGKNDPEVTSLCPPSTEKCKDIPVEIKGDLPSTSVDLKFYLECFDKEAKVPVPRIEERKVERCEFKRHTYQVDCCKITVCVPCRSCETISKACVVAMSENPVKLQVCQRRDGGNWDVYVLDVPGMPKRWMLYLDEQKSTIVNELGITLP